MEANSRSKSNSLEHSINAILTSPWLWGMAATFVFYASMPYFPANDEMKRYFTTHWLEYVMTDLFFTAACSLLTKFQRISIERKPLCDGVLEGLTSDINGDDLSCASQIEAHLDNVAKKFEDTILIKRVRDVCGYVNGRQSASGIEGFLAYLEKQTCDLQIEGYSLVRAITWAMPALGIIGTILGMTVVAANIGTDNEQTMLPDLMAGLALTLDTTVLSLGLSTILFLSTFIVIHSEKRTIDAIREYCMTRILSLFPTPKPVVAPSAFSLAEQQASEQLLTRTESMINLQMEMWQESIENLRERWSKTLSHQQEQLERALQTGLTNGIVDHSQQLTDMRSEFISAFQSVSATIREQLSGTCSVLAEQQHVGSEQIAQTWQRFRMEITQTRDEHARQLALLTQAISAEVGGWQNQLESCTQTMSHQFEELRSQGDVFLKITENESELIRLERRLTENLEAVKVVESLEQTVINLNAAVNLLTTRMKSKAA